MVGILLEATRAAAGEYASRWNWAREDKALRRMCITWLVKHPVDKSNQVELDVAQPERENTAKVTANAGEAKDDATPGNVADLGAARAKKKAKAKAKAAADMLPAFLVADTVIKALRDGGEDIMLSEGELWFYGEGVWRIADRADEQRLVTMVQAAFDALALPARGCEPQPRAQTHQGAPRAV